MKIVMSRVLSTRIVGQAIRRVVPGRLHDRGFEFKYPEWPDAAVDLCERYQEAATKVTK